MQYHKAGEKARQLSAQTRAGNRAFIKALPSYKTGFTRKELSAGGMEVSVARRELREMVGDGALEILRKESDGTLVYCARPVLLSQPWVANSNDVRIGMHLESIDG